MKNRKLNIVSKRIRNLPKGSDLPRYISNNLKNLISKRNKNLVLPHPNFLMMELTNHCQLKCITCAREYNLGAAMDKGNMDVKMAKKVIDEAYPYIDKVGLTGLGEPLIYPYLKEVIEYIKGKSKGISIFISTNAQLPAAVQVIEEIADNIDTVQVSIDGIDSVFEEIRRNASFSAFRDILGNIMHMKDRKAFDVKLNMVVFDKNYHQMAEVVDIAHEYKISEVYMNSLNLVSIGLDRSNISVYGTDEFNYELDRALARAKLYNIHLEIPKFGKNLSFSDCPYPWSNFYISWDGFLVPCCAKPFPKEKHFGNVFANGLMPCINNEGIIEFRKKSLAGEIPDFCKGCHYCTGRG